MTDDADEELIGRHRFLDLLAMPEEVGDIDFEVPRSREIVGPAVLD